MTQDTKSPWGNGDEAAAKAAALADAEVVHELPPELQRKAQDKNPLAEMMRAMKAGLEGLAPERSADEKVALLSEAAAFYTLGAINRFEIGDLVTPSQNTDMVGAGEPHLVVELRSMHADIDALDSGPHIGGLAGSHGDAKFGAILDMRVLGLNRVGDVVAWWVEGWKFEHYQLAKVAKAA